MNSEFPVGKFCVTIIKSSTWSLYSSLLKLQSAEPEGLTLDFLLRLMWNPSLLSPEGWGGGRRILIVSQLVYQIPLKIPFFSPENHVISIKILPLLPPIT